MSKMQFIGVARLGRDARFRAGEGNTSSVANLTLACDYGYGDNKKTEWLEAALWGKRADALSQYLVKGHEVFVVVEDLHIETFQRQDNTLGHKLVGKITTIELVGSKPAGAPAPPAQAPAAAAPRAPAPAPAAASRSSAPPF